MMKNCKYFSQEDAICNCKGRPSGYLTYDLGAKAVISKPNPSWLTAKVPKTNSWYAILKYEIEFRTNTKIPRAIQPFNQQLNKSTMRKNLPKTLDQLIFCKYTLNTLKSTKYLVNVHKFTKYLVNSYHQICVRQYIFTNWNKITTI